MANFTWEVKRDLIASPPENACCKVAALSAFLRTSGAVTAGREGVGFEIVSENDRVAEYFVSLLESVYGVRMELREAVVDPKRSRDKLTFSCRGEQAARILAETGILRREAGSFSLSLGISPYLTENDCCALAYVKGAFLGGGSCTLPQGGSKTGYHLEFVFSHMQAAEEFCLLLERFELLAKCIVRGESVVVYMKSRDALSDFFSLVGAKGALKKLNAVSASRDEANYENRANNCLTGNIDRTARASANQALAIGVIQKKIGLSSLDPALAELAALRLSFPMESLSELAARLRLSKSCVNHRMRRLMEIYNGLEH